MKAFIEVLSGIIRVGPDCDQYGKPFDYAVAFSSVDGKTAVVKALMSDGSLTQTQARVALRTLNDLGLTPTWDRFDFGDLDGK